MAELEYKLPRDGLEYVEHMNALSPLDHVKQAQYEYYIAVLGGVPAARTAEQQRALMRFVEGRVRDAWRAYHQSQRRATPMTETED